MEAVKPETLEAGAAQVKAEIDAAVANLQRMSAETELQQAVSAAALA